MKRTITRSFPNHALNQRFHFTQVRSSSTKRHKEQSRRVVKRRRLRHIEILESRRAGPK